MSKLDYNINWCDFFRLDITSESGIRSIDNPEKIGVKNYESKKE